MLPCKNVHFQDHSLAQGCCAIPLLPACLHENMLQHFPTTDTQVTGGQTKRMEAYGAGTALAIIAEGCLT